MPEIYDFDYFPTLTTERLHLRQMTHADAPAMVAIFSDPAVLRFMSGPPITTVDEARGLIDRVSRSYSAGETVRWGITLNSDDSWVIGTCGFYHWRRADRHVEIGYDLASAHWGKGYATEAVQALVAWCFTNLGVHRIEGDCTDGNRASERVMRKLGFQHEGTWRERSFEHGRFVDQKQFGLLRREWEAAGGHRP